MADALAWCGQGLVEHLRNVATLILNPQKYPLTDRVNVREVDEEVAVVAARLAKVMGLDAGFTRKLLALAGYLHDVGKAHPNYQQSLTKWCGVDEDKISLAGHELLSAWVTYHVVHNLVGNDDAAAPFVAGVLLHHSGRRSIDEAYYRMREHIRNPDLLLSRLKTYIEDAVGIVNLGLDTDRVMSEINYYFGDVVRPLENVVLVRTMNSRYAKYGELITYTIALADDIDSFNARGSYFTPIIIRRFLKQ